MLFVERKPRQPTKQAVCLVRTEDITTMAEASIGESFGVMLQLMRQNRAVIRPTHSRTINNIQ